MKKSIRILKGNVGLMEKCLRRLARHAEKMGYGAVGVIKVGAPYEARRMVLDHQDGEVSEHNYAVSVVDVDIELPEQFANPVAAEWNVIGRVTRIDDKLDVSASLENLSVVNSAGKGFDWKCGSCQHPLGKAYAVQSKADGSKIVLVGSECLKKYTGADGEAILRAVEFLSVIEFKDRDGEEGCGGGCGTRYHAYDLDEFLAVAIAVVRKDGNYVKRWQDNDYGDHVENPRCTRNQALCCLDRAASGASIIDVIVTDDDRETAVAQIEAWKVCYMPMRKRTDGEPGLVPDDYITQCKEIAERGWVSEISAGVAASMVKNPPVPPKDYSGSAHVGNVGERKVFKDLTVILVREIEGDFGVTTLVKFADPSGNVLVWFASGAKDYKRDDKATLKATVKKLDEYDGVKQTVITRAVEV